VVLSPVQYNFKLIDFDVIMSDISSAVLRDLNNFGLNGDTKITPNIKRLILHHTIFTICELLINKKQKQPFVFYFVLANLNSKLHKFYGRDEINKIMLKIIQRLTKLLPIRIYNGNITFTNLKGYIDGHNGEGIDMLMQIKMYLDSINTDKFTFSKIRVFVMQNKLTFLSKEYFDRLKTKQLLFT
jgi:hypothetical protein